MDSATQARLDQRSKEIIASQVVCTSQELNPEDSLADDLGLDSLDLAEIRFHLEDELLQAEIDDAEVDAWKTVADLLRSVREAAEK